GGGVLPGREYLAEGLVIQGGVQQQRNVPHGGDMRRVLKAGDVAEMGILHAQRGGPLVHALYKGLFVPGRAAGQRDAALGAGGQQRAVQQVPHRDGLTGGKARQGGVGLPQRREDAVFQRDRRVQVGQGLG